MTQDADGSAPMLGSHGAFGLEAAMVRIESGDIRDADAVLVVKRLRECRSKTARWCDHAARQSPTDEERRAVKTAIEWLTTLSSRRREIHSADLLLQDARTLRGMLERLT